MTAVELDVVVPGAITQRTGGYIYDARMVDGLRGLGWTVRVHELAGRFPDGGEGGERALRSTLASMADGRRVLIDGLAVGALPRPVSEVSDRLRVVALVHHPLGDESGLDTKTSEYFLQLERETLSVCRGVVVTSRFTQGRLAGLGVPEGRIRVVRPGTDPVVAVRVPEASPPVLLTVGAVVPRKGQLELARTLARLSALPWAWVCLGSLDRDQTYATAVRDCLDEAGLSSRVRWLGECDGDTVDAWYRRASLFVMPSYYEGYGMALADAVAYGVPVVSTTGGAIPYTVPAAAALLVPPGDEAALGAALDSLLSCKGGEERRATLAAAARDEATKLPGWGDMVRLFARALEELAPDGAI